MKLAKSKTLGFTLLEIILVVGIVTVLTATSLFVMGRMQSRVSSRAADITILSSLYLAANHARSGYQDSAWGVYFTFDEVERTANEIIIFAGDDFVSRDQSLDIVIPFPEGVTWDNVSLSGEVVSDGNDHEVVFTSLTGETASYGTIEITVFDNIENILISPEGITTRTQ